MPVPFRRRRSESNWQPGEMPIMDRELTQSLPPRQRRLLHRAPLQPLAAGHGGYWQPKAGVAVPWDKAQAILAAKMAQFDSLDPGLRMAEKGFTPAERAEIERHAG